MARHSDTEILLAGLRHWGGEETLRWLNGMFAFALMDFGAMIEHWLQGPLSDWAETSLDEKRLREEGFFDPALIRNMLQKYVSGKRHWHA